MASQDGGGCPELTDMTSQLTLTDDSPPHLLTTPPEEGHAHPDSDQEDLLSRSTGDEVGRLLRATVEELEAALQVRGSVLVNRQQLSSFDMFIREHKVDEWL